jgi:hypothetical protein
MSSILTIGYISQEITPNDLSSEEIDSIVLALMNNMRTDNNVEILSSAITFF